MTAKTLTKRQQDIIYLSELGGAARRLGKWCDALGDDPIIELKEQLKDYEGREDVSARAETERDIVETEKALRALRAEFHEAVEKRVDLLKRMDDGHRKEIEEARKLVYLRYLECVRNAVGEPERGHWKPESLYRDLWCLTDMLRSIEQEHGYAALDSVVPDQPVCSLHQWAAERGELEAEIARVRPHVSDRAVDWLKDW